MPSFLIAFPAAAPRAAMVKREPGSAAVPVEPAVGWASLVAGTGDALLAELATPSPSPGGARPGQHTLRAARSTSAAEAGRKECEAATRIRAELRAFRAAAESNQLAQQVPTSTSLHIIDTNTNFAIWCSLRMGCATACNLAAP